MKNPPKQRIRKSENKQINQKYMKNFFNVEDIGDIDKALAEAQEVKKNRFAYQQLGKNKTLLMIFFNNSLRTRLSTQKAALNLGMNVMVLEIGRAHV